MTVEGAECGLLETPFLPIKMTQSNFWQSLTKSAADLGKTVTDAASQATQTVTETAAKAGEAVSSTIVQAGEVVTKTVIGVGSAAHKTLRDWVCFSENDSLAFYGALFAVAAADGSIDADELNLILSSPDLANLSSSAKQQIQNYSVSPPSLEESLKKLSKADEKLRFGLMFYILNIVWVDKVLNPGEEQAIQLAQKELGIANAQVKSIDAFVQKMGEIRERGLNDEYATTTLKEATANLKKVGVPIESFAPSEAGGEFSTFSIPYSDDLFWEKLRNFSLQAGKTVVEEALVLFYAAEHPNTPKAHKMLIYGALAYLILPADAIPDILPAVGFSDDLGALAVAAASVVSNINLEVKEAAKEKIKEWFGEAGDPR